MLLLPCRTTSRGNDFTSCRSSTYVKACLVSLDNPDIFLAAGILAAFQFVPKIRHSALLAHRINGYVNILLILIGNAGALIIARRAQGGSIQTQSAVGVLVILTTVGIFMAYINVKRLQIDQHRNWMLRTLFYLGCIITTRIIMIISARILTRVDSYYELWPCDKLEYTMGNQNYTFKLYPSCATHPEIPVAVKATFNGTSAANVGSALGLSFGMALWVAIFIHLIGVEFYIQLTPGESRRLRKVSFERQLEAGFGNPGNAGLTAARFGDDSDDFEEAALKDKLTPVGSHRYSDGSLNM